MNVHGSKALEAIAAVASPHQVGHRCVDGQWANQHAGSRNKCAVLTELEAAATHVRAMHDAVHEAAHEDQVSLRVGAAAAGYDWDGMDHDNDTLLGFISMGRMAIESLAEHLDRDPAREARLESTRARLAAAGITPTD